MSDGPRFTKESLLTRLCWEQLDPDYLRQLVGLAKIEDLAGAGLAERPEQLGDATTALMAVGVSGAAQLTARENMTLCGLGLVELVLASYGEDCSFEAKVQDGGSLAPGTPIGILRGPAATLLQAERILLNFLQHLSGIATETRHYVNALDGSATALLDTRKTLPGYRVLQKYAFACGGGYNHRMGLFDRVMFKDNHLALTGAKLTETVELARSIHPSLPVEVEVDQLEQIEPGLAGGADIILLDNFKPEALKQAITQIGERACTEASGGITLEALPALGALGLDFISTGAPVHQSTWKDIGLDWL
jgi:nicotinate-nucleotide pyrophosphorylase (carboxylating)